MSTQFTYPRYTGRVLFWSILALASPAWAGWESGDFQKLPTLEVSDLGQFVTDASQMPHPTQGYVVPSQTRTANFQALLKAVFQAVDTMLAGYPKGATPWCDIVTHQAPRAQYEIRRLWEQTSKRYFLYLKDIASAMPQEAYILINPEPTRRLVLGVPHTRDSADPQTSENYTAKEGAQLFTTLGARALLINGATRCASPLRSRCTGGTTTQCSRDATPRLVTVADAAHVTTTFFYVAHRSLLQRDATLKIAQLHGKADGPAQAIVGDGTPIKQQAGAVSVVFAGALARLLGPEQRVDACQGKGSLEDDLCGTRNAEGRLVNHPGGDACLQGATQASGRFLHIEQNRSLGTSHADAVSAALQVTWWHQTGCDAPNSPRTCDLRPQTQTPDVPCP